MPETRDEQFISTRSPRDTLKTFLWLVERTKIAIEAYRRDRTRENFRRIVSSSLETHDLIELSDVPQALRRELANDTIAALADIIGRIELPPLEKVPAAGSPGMDEPGASWRIPRTPILIVRIDDGPREGEFLFTERTARVAPRFAARIEDMPLRDAYGVESWSREVQDISGPLFPAEFIEAIPERYKAIWLDTPIWKIVVIFLLAVLVLASAFALNWLLVPRTDKVRLSTLLRWLIAPTILVIAIFQLDRLAATEINITGDFARVYDSASIIVFAIAMVWIVWLSLLALFEAIILSPRIPEEGLDANLLRLLARMVGIVVGFIIIGIGAQKIGLPLFSVIAGLGVGGLAVALALRPTMENLIGGMVLYLDKPARVGDFCSFGTKVGTVESIGVRSTQVRGLDRTLISIPNAQFADMELVNWARCDKMLIEFTFGLRYETPPDRVRYVLVALREMFFAHPKIEVDSVRVRLAGFAESSKTVLVRVYALTNDWSEFFAIQEDVLLRVDEIVAESGAGFAVPSRTLYVGRDQGLDEERGKASEDSVEDWRRRGTLPFPTTPTERLRAIAGTLDYPPRGSLFATTSTAPVEAAAAEPLSTGSDSDEDEGKQEGDGEKKDDKKAVAVAQEEKTR